ncbi:Gti1/Pac2 family-domain-containing protein [Kalaharituber pfeilii]|nr:Gti1/Pac2 family-domain-containing protein [Kalaharituber pfeilii]
METYHGHVRTPADAIILFEACRLGLLPRVQRRLSEKERQSIKSGSIFVWDEREAGMRRWTDGKSWSASRVSGSFLTYREMEGKRGGGNAFAPPVTVPHRKSPNGDSDSDHLDIEGPDGYRYKPDGLMKQSFSITTATNQKLHLISYYARSHPNSMNLMQPSQDPQLKHIRPAKGMYPESTVHEQQNVPIMSHSNSQRPQIARFRPQAATHPHSYSQPVQIGSPYTQQPWLPSPTATPPTQYASQLPFPVQGQLPPPITSANGNYITQGSSGQQYDGSASQQHQQHPQSHQQQRTSMPSPLMHLRTTAQSSPRMSQDLSMQRQPSIPADTNGPIRYSSPGASSHASARTPPRTVDSWEMNPIRGSPDMNGRTNGMTLPGPGEMSPVTGAKLLDVQDIPSEKIFSNEDVRTLRMLDKAFVA